MTMQPQTGFTPISTIAVFRSGRGRTMQIRVVEHKRSAQQFVEIAEQQETGYQRSVRIPNSEVGTLRDALSRYLESK